MISSIKILQWQTVEYVFMNVKCVLNICVLCLSCLSATISVKMLNLDQAFIV